MESHAPSTHCAVEPLAIESLAELGRLGDEIAELSAHLTAATARLLDLIREFDARGGWSHGFVSCAAWLTWRVGLAPGAAREHVRVARALGTLPRLARALACGELSYSKVRELTRVATPETEDRLLHEEGFQVEREPDGELRFHRPDGRPLPEVPPPIDVPDDPLGVLRAWHEVAGLDLHAHIASPGWLGETLDVGYAIDVLHPLAR